MLRALIKNSSIWQSKFVTRSFPTDLDFMILSVSSTSLIVYQKERKFKERDIARIHLILIDVPVQLLTLDFSRIQSISRYPDHLP